MFSRRQELDELVEKMKRLERRKAEAEAATGKVKAEVEALTAELTATTPSVSSCASWPLPPPPSRPWPTPNRSVWARK
jgi:chromosome segregation ATPase